MLQGKDVIFEGQMVIISHHTTCGVAATRVIEISRNTQEEAAARMMGRCCCCCYRKWLVSHAVQAAILDFEFSSLCLVTPALRSQIAACFVNCRVIVITASNFLWININQKTKNDSLESVSKLWEEVPL